MIFSFVSIKGILLMEFPDNTYSYFQKSIVFSNKNITFLNISVKTLKHQPSL
jgi:hypothetical protein